METQNDLLKLWIPIAKEKKATHILDIVDSFNYEHYPIFILDGDNIEEIKNKYNSMEMQRVFDVIKIEDEIKPIYVSPIEIEEFTKNKFGNVITPKEKMLFRNYASDTVQNKRDIFILLCKGFDELQTDIEGVSYSDMMVYIMRHSNGKFNPMIVQEILNEFKK
jgi:hypothetical protein